MVLESTLGAMEEEVLGRISQATARRKNNDVQALRALSRLLRGREMTEQDRQDVLTVRAAIHRR